MTIAINGSKSGVANLYDLLNTANPGNGFTETNLSIGAVSTSIEPDNNTEVPVTALSNQGFSGEHRLYYNRLAPGVAHGKTGDMKVLISISDSQTQIRDKIIAAVGCIAADVTVTGNGTSGAFKMPADEDDTSCSFTITAKASSYVYMGSFTALLTIPDTDVPLTTAITQPILGGFVAG